MFPNSGHPAAKPYNKQRKTLKNNDLTIQLHCTNRFKTSSTLLFKAYFSELLHRPPSELRGRCIQKMQR
jgi:hypothetical protein